jgi:hypothetical protein
MRVIPKADGTCPSCQAVISPTRIAKTSKSALPKPSKASLPLEQKAPAVTKSISSTRVADKGVGSQSQLKAKDASSLGKADQQPVEHVPSKLESRYTFAMSKTVDYIFILIVLVVVGDWIIEHRLNFDVILRFGLLGAVLLFIFLMIFGKPKKE